MAPDSIKLNFSKILRAMPVLSYGYKQFKLFIAARPAVRVRVGAPSKCVSFGKLALVPGWLSPSDPINHLLKQNTFAHLRPVGSYGR